MTWTTRNLRWALASSVLCGCTGDDAGSDTNAQDTGAASTSVGDDGNSADATVGNSETSIGTSASQGSNSMSATVTQGDDTSAGSTIGDDTAGDDSGSTSAGGAECPECTGVRWCDWPANSCGVRGREGTCEARPNGCDDIYQPVCGCDGVVHSNECEAQSAGADVDATGQCVAPEGFFACGFRFCDPAFAYCQVAVDDTGGADGYTCLGLPKGCGETPDCACLVDEPCADFSCEATDDGGLLIVCPGG